MSLTADGASAPNASARAASGRRLFGAEGLPMLLTLETALLFAIAAWQG